MERQKKERISLDLYGQVALVTGASSGLGREFSLKLARAGCHVVAAARRVELLKSLVEEIDSFPKHGSDGQQPLPGRAAAVQMDVSTNEQEVDAAVEKAWQAFGKIDVLVNNAGFRGTVKSPLDLDEEEWDKVMATNLRGVWLVAKCVGKRMRMMKLSGSIINISSIAGLERTLLPGAVAYGASKSGLNQLTKTMAIELGRHNIRVNAIAAGLFRSEITSKLLDQEWVHTAAKKIIPTERWGKVDPELTSLVLMLASNLSSYITGCIFVLDGGQSIPGVPVWSSL